MSGIHLEFLVATIDTIIIGATIMCDSNIELFYIAPYKVIALYLLWFRKEASNQCTKPTKNIKQRVNCTNFYYCKVGGAMTKWKPKEKNSILLSQYWRNNHFDNEQKSISYFWGTNNIFAIASGQAWL